MACRKSRNGGVLSIDELSEESPPSYPKILRYNG